MPTELADAANPLALAFHVSAQLAESEVTDPAAFGNYWGVGRRKAREAKDVLVAHGLWFEMQVPQQRPDGKWAGWNTEYRTVETRATDRDLAELATEYIAGTRITTAGRTWRVDDAGHVELISETGHAPSGWTTETGHAPSGWTTETGPVADQGWTTETGHAPSGGRPKPVPSQIKSTTETGHAPAAPLKEEKEENFPKGKFSSNASLKGDAAPLRKAGDGAPENDPTTNEVKDLVRRLPWEQTRFGRTPEIERAAEREIVPAIRKAVHGYGDRGVTVEYARDHALNALAGGAKQKGTNGLGLVRYVAGAFSDDHLKLPSRTDTLPLPEREAPKKAPESSMGATNGASGRNDPSGALGGACDQTEPLIAGCESCTDANAPGFTHRADGRLVKCSCHPSRHVKSA